MLCNPVKITAFMSFFPFFFFFQKMDFSNLNLLLSEDKISSSRTSNKTYSSEYTESFLFGYSLSLFLVFPINKKLYE